MEVGKINKVVHDLLSDRSNSDAEEFLVPLLREYPYFSLSRMSFVLFLHRSDDHRKKSELSRLALNCPNMHDFIALLNRKQKADEVVKPNEASVLEMPGTRSEEGVREVSKLPVEQPSKNKLRPAKKEEELEKIILPSIIEFNVLRDLEGRPNLNIEKRDEKEELRRKSVPKSFNEWLEILDSDKIITQKEEERTPSTAEIVSQFIQTNKTRIDPLKKAGSSDLALRSVTDDSEIVTETLAKVYEAQGNKAKAIATYEKLLLLNPEKKAYFAARIESLK